jgi:ABC-2 type transport system permease protein
MSDWRTRFTAVFEREVRTLVRSRSVWLVAGGFAAILLTVAGVSGRAGYVPLVLALLTPTEVLVPVLAVTLGYRAVLGDRRSGELQVMQTFPLSALEYGLGVYCGRFAIVAGVVAVTLIAAAAVVPLFGPTAGALAGTRGLDSPVYYARYVSLTVAFAAVVLAVTMVVSSLARTARRGLVFGVAALLVLVVGFDLAVVVGVGQQWVTERGLGVALAASPVSAYRGLVLTYAVAPAVTMPVHAASAVASWLSLAIWWWLSLFTASRLTGLD